MAARFLWAPVLIALFVAGCAAPGPQPTGGATGPAISPSPTPTFRHEIDLPTQSPEATSQPSPSTAVAIDACTLVTQAEAEAILSVTLVEPEREDVGPGGQANTCHYPDATGERLATLVVLALGDAPGTYATIAADTAGIDRTYADLGDAAVCSIEVLDFVTLYALHGSRLVEVISADCDLAEAIARTAVARLP